MSTTRMEETTSNDVKPSPRNDLCQPPTLKSADSDDVPATEKVEEVATDQTQPDGRAKSVAILNEGSEDVGIEPDSKSDLQPSMSTTDSVTEPAPADESTPAIPSSEVPIILEVGTAPTFQLFKKLVISK
jgi:hypothetical protein